MKKITTDRWLQEDQFSPKWKVRNELLFNLIDERLPDLSSLSYSEYGCGPFSPFTSLAVEKFSENYRLDIKAWDENVLICDLNNISKSPPPYSDIGVLSGVLEYITSPEQTLDQLKNFHDRLLISYATYTDGDLENRVRLKGWRNHYNLYDFIKITKYFGFIENIGQWGRQTLLLLRKN